MVSNRLRLGLTNIYSIDEYKNQSLLFYLDYFVLYKLMHNPTPSFAEEQILFRRLNKTNIKQLQSVLYLTFSLNSLAHISSSF